MTCNVFLTCPFQVLKLISSGPNHATWPLPATKHWTSLEPQTLPTEPQLQCRARRKLSSLISTTFLALRPVRYFIIMSPLCAPCFYDPSCLLLLISGICLWWGQPAGTVCHRWLQRLHLCLRTGMFIVHHPKINFKLMPDFEMLLGKTFKIKSMLTWLAWTMSNDMWCLYF